MIEQTTYLLPRLACRVLRLHTRGCRGRRDHVRIDGSVRVRWGIVSDKREVNDLEVAQHQLRDALGLRPETRLDVLILRDGTAYVLRADGQLDRVQ